MNSTPRCVCYYFLLSSTKTVLNFPLPALLQSLIHTRHTSGFIIPGAHHVQHNSRPPANITIVAADGNAIEAETFKAGSLFRGKIPFRTYEPLVMYHYVQRDLEVRCVVSTLSLSCSGSR
jgi:hypothetical protein